MMSKYFDNYKKIYSLILVMLLLLIFLCGCGAKNEEMIESVDQLNDSGISLLLSPGSASAATALEQFPKAKHSYITSLPDAYLSIQNGNADAFVYDDLCMRAALAEGDMTDLTIMEESLAEVEIIVGLNPEQDELLIKVNEFISQMKEDGTLEDMERRWIDEGSEVMPDIPKAENPTTTLNFGTSGLIRPMNYYGENNTLTGFDVELIRRMALYLNVNYTLEAMSFDALTASLQSGRLDIVASQLNVTEERREVLLLSDPYITSETKVMIRKDRLAESTQLENLDDLNGKRLGTVTASLYIPVLAERYPESELIQYSSYSDVVQALHSDRLDVFVVAEPIAKQIVKSSNGLYILDGTVADERLGFIFPLSHTELRDSFNSVLERLKNEGVLDELESKWIDGEGNEEIDIPEIMVPKKGILKIASRYDNAPFSYMKGEKPIGYDVELLYMIASELGYELEFTYGDFATVIAEVTSGKSDVGIGSIIYTDERTESLHFTEPTYSTHAVAFAKGENKALNDMSQLDGKHLGTVNASVYISHMEDEYPDSKITQFNSHSEGIQALRSGRIDAYILGTAEAKPVTAQMPEIKALGGGKVEDQLGFIFPLHHTKLRQEFNDALAQLKEQGVLTELEEKWFSGDDNAAVVIPELSGASKGTLSVACSFDSKPFAYIANNAPAGYDVELLYMIAAACGYELDIVSQDFGAMLTAIGSGKADVGIGCITYTKERAEAMLFTDTTYNDGICAIVMGEDEETEGGFFSGLLASFDRTLIRENRWQIVLDGLLVTLMLGILSMFFGTMLGFLYSFPLRSKNKFIKKISSIISTILDRVPLLVILMVLYYIIFAKTSLPAVVIGVFGFTISFANSVAGILNTGIMAVDKGELEAATAMGYSKWQVFTKISFPQAANQMFGSYASSVVALINGTSIIGYITVQDLTKASDIIRGSTYEAFFPLFLTAAIYFALTSVFVAVLSVLAKKLDPKHRKRQVKEA